MADNQLYVIKIVYHGDFKLLPGEIGIEYFNQHGNENFRLETDPLEKAREFFCNKATPSKYSKLWAMETREVVQFQLEQIANAHNTRARKMGDWDLKKYDRLEFFTSVVKWNKREFEKAREQKLQRIDQRAVRLRASERSMFHQLQRSTHPDIMDDLDEQYPIRS